ncbi:MAG: (2Fe-2S)-binding protein [Pseudomonadota bacterium]
MIEFTLNGKAVSSSAEPNTPLLWVIRDELGLKGTKFGCGIAQCGACTIHIAGGATRSCQVPVSAAAGQEISTIEGFDGEHPLQKAWVEAQVPQCGYCQSGQIMQAAALLEGNPNPSDDEIRQGMAGNLCRCMAYKRIHAAIRKVADEGGAA